MTCICWHAGTNVDAVETMPYDVVTAEVPVEPVPPRLGEAASDEDEPGPESGDDGKILGDPVNDGQDDPKTCPVEDDGNQESKPIEVDPKPNDGQDDPKTCPLEDDGNQESKPVEVDPKPKSGDEPSSQGFSAMDFQDINLVGSEELIS